MYLLKTGNFNLCHVVACQLQVTKRPLLATSIL